jgi:hypothetical protein
LLKYKSNASGITHLSKGHYIFENKMLCGASSLVDATLALIYTADLVTCEECLAVSALGEDYQLQGPSQSQDVARQKDDYSEGS